MEKRLQLWSPVWGWLATKEGESVDLKGQDLVLYETAIQEALEQEKLYYRKKSAPFNLMDYYDADDSVKEKVQNLDIQVKKEQDGLYVCASLALIEPLTQQELEAIQNFLSRQYEGGIFDTSRIRTYSVEEGAHPQFPWLHRIRALVDVNEAVPKGTLGGFVEYEQNLSQEGSCWIYDQAICCERAVVERSAGLFQEAIAKGDALLTGTAVMYQTSIAEESCRILAGEVWNMAHIRGFAKITAAKETGDAPLILGNSLVFGNVCGKVLVRGNVLPSRNVENQTQELLVFRGGDSIHKVNESKKKTKSKKQPER